MCLYIDRYKTSTFILDVATIFKQPHGKSSFNPIGRCLYTYQRIHPDFPLITNRYAVKNFE